MEHIKLHLFKEIAISELKFFSGILICLFMQHNSYEWCGEVTISRTTMISYKRVGANLTFPTPTSNVILPIAFDIPVFSLGLAQC
jgi:hypothetical protein